MKTLLTNLAVTLTGPAILVAAFLSWVGWRTLTDSGSTVSRHRLNEVQSSLDHQRQYTYLLSQRLTERESAKQLSPAKQ